MGSFLVKLLADPGEFKFYSGNSEGQVGSVSTANSFGQKSIPFGKDRPGGGSSNQPYVKGIGLTATGTTTVASAWNNFIASFASNNASFFTAGTVYPLLDSSNYGAGKLSGFGSSTKYLWGNTIEQIAGVSNLTKSMIYAVDNLPNIPDSIIRGGLKGLPRSVIDATRLTKYFLDYKNPSGVLFIAKQNLLSRTEVKTEPSRAGLAYLEGVLNGGIYTPISTIGQAATNFAGIHLNKQGIDPTGIIPQLSIRDYQTVVYNRNQGDISAENDKGYYKRTARKIEKIDKLKSRLEEAKKGFEVNKIFDEGVEARRKYTVTYGGKTYNSFYEAELAAIATKNTNLQLELNISQIQSTSPNVSSFINSNEKNQLKAAKLKDQELKREIEKEIQENEKQKAFNEKQIKKLPEKITEAEEDLEEFTLGGNYKNRLLRLWDKFGLNIDNPVESTKYTLLSYGGGPGSILGIGRTKIKFATLNDGITPARTGLNRRDPYGDPKSKVNYGNTSPNNSISYAASSIYGYGQNENSVFYKALNRGIATPTEYFGDTDYLSRLEDTSYLVEGNSNYLQKGWASIASGTDPTEIKLNPSGIPISSKQYSTWDEFFFSIQPKNLEKKTLEDFRTRLKTQEGYTFLSLSPDYTTKNIETRLNLGKRSGGPGVSGRRIDYTIGKRDAFGNFLGPVDTINAFPIYRSKIDEQPSSDLINDIIPFKISILDNNDPNKLFHVHLRAFIDDFSDGYKASWKKIEYMGRGEKFFKYSGFDRDISFGFTVAAQSKEELIPIYKKLNFLASSLSPFYTDNGYMAGNISYITLGDYLINQPGIIESMNIDVEKESPWEIGIGIDGNRDPNAPRLPFIVKVKMKFTPIHSFRPEIQNITGMQTYSNITEDTIYPDSSKFGTQRYISTIPSDNPLYNKVSRTDSPIADSSPIDQQEFWINLPEDQRNPFEILVGDESTFYYNTMQPSQPGIIQSPPTQTPFPENVIFPQPPNPVTVP